MTGASWTKSMVLLNFESETNLSYPRWPMSQAWLSVQQRKPSAGPISAGQKTTQPVLSVFHLHAYVFETLPLVFTPGDIRLARRSSPNYAESSAPVSPSQEEISRRRTGRDSRAFPSRVKKQTARPRGTDRKVRTPNPSFDQSRQPEIRDRGRAARRASQSCRYKQRHRSTPCPARRRLCRT